MIFSFHVFLDPSCYCCAFAFKINRIMQDASCICFKDRPPPAMLERVRQQCEGVEDGGGGLVLVTSFGIEPPRTLPQCLKVIGRGHLPETVEALEAHPELKVSEMACVLSGCPA